MKPIVWDSQFDKHSTYGVISTRLCEELIKLGIDVRIKPWKESTKLTPLLESIKDKPREGISVRLSGIDSIGNEDINFIPDFVPSLNSKKGLEQIKILRSVKNLMIPSIFQKMAFNSLYINSVVIPRGSDFKEIKRPKNRSKYTFLFIGYLSNYKGLDILAKAYSKANPKNATLILKGNSEETHPDQLSNEEIYKLFKTDNIRIIKENWDYEKLEDLYKESDCFLSPHKTLGMFGTRVALDARITGLPLIAPKLGEPILWGDTRFLTDYSLEGGGIKPDVDQFAKYIKLCAENRIKAKPLNNEEWTWEKAANKFKNFLYEKYLSVGR